MTCLKPQQGLHCSNLRKESEEDAVLSYEMHAYEKRDGLDFDIPLDCRLCKVQHHRRLLGFAARHCVSFAEIMDPWWDMLFFF